MFGAVRVDMQIFVVYHRLFLIRQGKCQATLATGGGLDRCQASSPLRMLASATCYSVCLPSTSPFFVHFVLSGRLLACFLHFFASPHVLPAASLTVLNFAVSNLSSHSFSPRHSRYPPVSSSAANSVDVFGSSFSRRHLAMVVCYADIFVIMMFLAGTYWIRYKEAETVARSKGVTPGASL